MKQSLACFVGAVALALVMLAPSRASAQQVNIYVGPGYSHYGGYGGGYGYYPITDTGTATPIHVTDMGTGTDTIRAGGIATRGGLGDATGISCSSQAVGRDSAGAGPIRCGLECSSMSAS